ncbi:MAG: signal transduction diguanylate cyclase [Francisellaceae bacterium]|nr:signal transduction diguanylate cyclase [Francisellaceae bacterium]
MITGNLYVISAPSGTGKTSLVNALAQSMKNVKISVSHTTRPQRMGEQNGINYNFVNRAAFEKLIEQEVFLEYAEVYGNYYGTSKLWVEETLKKGNDVILEIDWQGALQIHKIFPHVNSIFILPPSPEALWERLSTREQDKREVIENRMKMAKSEITHFFEYDFLICNDRFEEALNELKAIVISNRLRLGFQELKYKELLKKLLKSDFKSPRE